MFFKEEVRGMTSTLPRSHAIWARLLVTLAVVVVYRLGVWVPLPTIDPERLQQLWQQLGQLSWWQALGGAIEHLSVFALGLTPYLNAAIFFSLIAFRSSNLRTLFLSKERTFSWWFWALILLVSLLQAAGMSFFIVTQGQTSWTPWAAHLVNVPVLMAGVLVLIWLGSLINRYGIGNGWAILIAVRILSDWPRYIVSFSFDLQTASWAWGLGVLVLFVLIVAGSLWAFASSRRVEGATRALTLPFLAVGIIPLELGSWLLAPVFGLANVAERAELALPTWLQTLAGSFAQGSWAYIVSYGVLVLLLTYFYKNAIFPPQAVRTLSAWGAGLFLAVIALMPSVLTRLSGLTTYFVGGTGILILVGVLVDASRRARMDLPFVGVYRTFSHVRAHEVRTQLEGAGIPSVLQTPMPYPYSVYPLLGPVEIAVPERERARAEEITRTAGPEAQLSAPPWESALWSVLVVLAVAISVIGIALRLSIWLDVAATTALIVFLAGLGFFWRLRRDYYEYAHWFLLTLLLIGALLYMLTSAVVWVMAISPSARR
jgi:preprotein translocase subunit SecY